MSEYYDISKTAVNWISTGFLFAFVVISPLTVYILHRGGPKPSIVTASIFLLLGNWIRYGATRSGKNGNYGGVMFGQILCGFAQPFVLAAPTRYSDLWFTNRGRVAATAVMSLANPFGGALAQLIDPEWAGDGSPQDIPNMVLYISIIVRISAARSLILVLMTIGNHCCCAVILYTGQSTNTLLSIWNRSKAAADKISPIPFQFQGVLYDYDPIRSLCWTV